MSSGSCEPVAPRYSEAYPRISALEARRECKRGRSHILWRNRHGHAIGTAELQWQSSNDLLIIPCIPDHGYLCSNKDPIKVEVVWKGSTRDNERPYFVCGKCAEHCDLIVYNQADWLCKRCQGLKNRSECIDEVIRISEELAKIEQLTGAGRPRGMRQSVFENNEKRRIELNVKLGGRTRRTASLEYLPRVTGEWPAPGLVIEHIKTEVTR
jgi:hypothetical protein